MKRHQDPLDPAELRTRLALGRLQKGRQANILGGVSGPWLRSHHKEGDIEEGRPETQHVRDSGDRKMVLSLNSHFGNDRN